MWKPAGPLHRPMYLSLAHEIERDIANKALLPGAQLPPQRELAEALKVNLSTVFKAFQICIQKGLLSTTVGRGTYVSYGAGVSPVLLGEHNAHTSAIEMGFLHPGDDLGEDIRDCIRRMVAESDIDEFFRYNPLNGRPIDMEAGAVLMDRAGHTTSPQNILLGAGGQNAVFAALAGVFKPGDRIGVDPITFPGIKTAANALGLQLVAVRQKDREMTEEGLLLACSADNIKGLYLIPDFHNPTTHTISVEKREAIAKIATRKNLIIVEDSPYALMHEKKLPSVASFAPQNAVYIQTTSKVISPGLRLSFLSVPGSLRKNISKALYNSNISVSLFMAELASRLILSGAVENIIKNRRAFVKGRNALVNKHLGGYEILGNDASFTRWLLLPETFSGESFELQALQAGVQVYAAERFATGMAKPENAVRLAVAAPQTDAETEQGLLILKNILEGFGAVHAVW